MRIAYREKLDNFAHDLILMCDTVQAIMSQASRALLTAALQPAEDGLSLSDELEELRTRCEERAVSLLALENPMAKDLRQVVSSIYIVEDLYRMGQLAKHIAKSARRRHPNRVVPEEFMGYLEELTRLVDEMCSRTRNALIDPDPQLALELASDDDAVDDINHHLITILTQREWKYSTRSAVDLAMLSRFYERYADHCVNVAARILYLSTGMLPDEYLARRADEDRRQDMEAHFAALERQFRR